MVGIWWLPNFSIFLQRISTARNLRGLDFVTLRTRLTKGYDEVQGVTKRSRRIHDPRLAAPLIENPFTHGEIGVLMRKGQDDLLVLVNAVIAQMKADSTLRQLHEKYGLVYGYE